jgi:hypothetical protein
MPQALPILRVRLGAGVTVQGEDLTPALAATLKHAASTPNPLFYERQRRRASTWNVPRFLRSYDETLDGGLVLPGGLLDTLTNLIEQLGGRLEITDHRLGGGPQTFTFAARLNDGQHAARPPCPHTTWVSWLLRLGHERVDSEPHRSP